MKTETFQQSIFGRETCLGKEDAVDYIRSVMDKLKGEEQNHSSNWKENHKSGNYKANIIHDWDQIDRENAKKY